MKIQPIEKQVSLTGWFERTGIWDISLWAEMFHRRCVGIGLLLSITVAGVVQAETCNGPTWTPDSRFVLKGGEAYDTTTKLTWKRCAEGMRWDGNGCTGTAEKYSWDAIKRFPLEGSDWRLPNADELSSIRAGNDDDNDESKLAGLVKAGCVKPAINPNVFVDGGVDGGSNFWSGSPHADYSNFAWVVHFYNGHADNYLSEKYAFFVRLVRGVQYFGPLVKSGKAQGAKEIAKGRDDSKGVSTAQANQGAGGGIKGGSAGGTESEAAGEIDVQSRNGLCKLTIPEQLIGSAMQGKFQSEFLDQNFAAAFHGSPLQWSGGCDSNNRADGENKSLTGKFSFLAKKQSVNNLKWYNVSYNATVSLNGTVKNGQFFGKLDFEIDVPIPGTIMAWNAKKTFFLLNGVNYSSLRDVEETANPSLKIARLKAEAEFQRAEEKRKTEEEKRQREESAAREHAWQAEINNKNPQTMYLKAGNYMRNGDTSKATELYEALIRRFPDSQWAVKASDQLSAKSRAEQYESNRRDEQYQASQQCRKRIRDCQMSCPAGSSNYNCYQRCKSICSE